MRRQPWFALFLLLCVAATALPAFGTTNIDDARDYTAFAALPIQHEGRIKPLESFARISLQQFHGAESIQGRPAIAWLAEAMFDPTVAVTQPLFLFKQADAQAMLQLPASSTGYYSFAELAPAIAAQQSSIGALLNASPQELSEPQRQVVTLVEHVQQFSQITLAMTPYLPMALPLDDVTRNALNLPAQDASFLALYHAIPALEKIADKARKQRHLSTAQKGVITALERLSVTQQSGRDNTLLKLLPPPWDPEDAWASPWTIFNQGIGSPQTTRLAQDWSMLAASYRTQDDAGWASTAQRIRLQTQSAPHVRPYALTLEIAYQHYTPLRKALLLYAAVLLLTLAAMWRPLQPAFYRGAMIATACGALLHGAAIIMRVTILERPPVGTLYESLLFVSWIAVLFGWYLSARLRTHSGLLAASLAGSFLLALSGNFAQGDSMHPLIAVLNTNFWLATHVLCVTAGYGFGLVAGILAHLYLITACRNAPGERLQSLLRNLYAVALIALLCTALGTILGGIWADQSWGRFWGWDPKENGALVICLWLIWLLHGRISGMLGTRGFVTGMALLPIVIALSWLGVNLLSVGLHSYGFTDRAAMGLALFCCSECLFAAVTYRLLWRRAHA